jgi:hypothetical protein
MKAIYTKPMLTVEMFSSTQPTARDCGGSIPKDQLNLSDPSTCVWDLGGGTTVFVAGSNCVIDGENMGYGCYNNPSEGNYIFRS